nr:flavin reductase [Methylobacterium sp. XJLW]
MSAWLKPKRVDDAAHVDPDEFRRCMREVPGAVAIITCGEPGERTGLTATAVCSLTDAPPTLLVCVNGTASAHPVICRTARFAVNILAEADLAVAGLFAGRTGLKGEDRFDQLTCTQAPDGSPIIEDALASFDVRWRRSIATAPTRCSSAASCRRRPTRGATPFSTSTAGSAPSPRPPPTLRPGDDAPRQEQLVNEFRMLSTSGILGYGFAEESLKIGMTWEPHVIGCDGGSTDPGPYYLGSGKSFTSRLSVKRDLRLMLMAAVAARIPCIIGTSGGAGGEPHLQDTAALVREIAREEGLSFKMALIHSEQPKDWLCDRIAEEKTRPLGKMKPLDQATVDRAERIVGMMGPEPFARALDEGAQVILAGRSSDPAQWAAPAMRAGIPPAPAWYAGKMLECGAEPTIPKEPDNIFLRVRDDHIVCEPPNPIRRSTPLAVANFALHENASPIHHTEPGGLLDTSACTFEAISDRAVRVGGMTWTPASTYTVKLEGVERVGYRAITICGTRDPVLIGQIDSYLETHRRTVATKAASFGVPPRTTRWWCGPTARTV